MLPYQFLYPLYILGSSSLSACNTEIENKTSFELTSPGYPNGYPTNKDCELIMRFGQDETVKLTFLEFYLEAEANCQ